MNIAPCAQPSVKLFDVNNVLRTLPISFVNIKQLCFEFDSFSIITDDVFSTADKSSICKFYAMSNVHFCQTLHDSHYLPIFIDNNVVRATVPILAGLSFESILTCDKIRGLSESGDDFILCTKDDITSILKQNTRKLYVSISFQKLFYSQKTRCKYKLYIGYNLIRFILVYNYKIVIQSFNSVT